MDTANAVRFTDSMLNLIEQNGANKYKEEYAIANYSKGDYLLWQKKYSQAYTHFYKARLISKRSIDSCTLAEYSYRLGMILYKQANFAGAAENFKEALAETYTCPFDFVHFFRIQEVLDNTALCFYNLDKCDSALMYTQKTLAYLQHYRDSFPYKAAYLEMAEAVVYGTMGSIYTKMGELPKARDMLKQSVAINTKPRYENQNAQEMQLALATVYDLMHQPDSMQYVLQQTRKSLDTLKNEKAEVEWNRLMWTYYDGKNESKAYSYLQKYTASQDSIAATARKVEQNDASEQIKNIENQYEITALQKENELKDLYLLIFLITTILAVVVFLFFLFNHRTSRSNIEALKVLNNQIEEQKITLQKTLGELEERNKDKDRILRVVAHDLRTPAASVVMLAELIQYETIEEKKNEMLRLIKTAANNSISLITELLDASGMGTSGELVKEETDINELLRNTTALLRFKAEEKQQQLQLYLLKENRKILVNKEKIGRVISNLLTNAIKFSLHGTEITIKATAAPDTILISVQDSGIGIPANLQSKVFDVFTEAKRKGTDGEKTFGLGLSICKQIVEAHNGKIWFDSEPGKGTTFYVELKGG